MATNTQSNRTTDQSRTTGASDVDVLKGKKILSYPVGLEAKAVDEYGHDKQFVMIKINTDTRASKLKDDSSTGDVLVLQQRSGTGIEVQTESQETLAKNTDPDIRTKYGAAAVSKENWQVQRGMTRLDKVIVLPMPNDHSVQTSVEYDNNYTPSGLTQGLDMYNTGGAAAADLMKLGGASLASGIINSLKSAVTSAGGDITSRDALLAANRLAVNPKKEVMFKSFGFRQFTFAYTFAPKSQIESETVNEIIETLRFYSLPEISDGRLFYILPAEFEIYFMLGQKDNPNIPRLATCVLQRVGVNYSPAGTGWVSLPNGSPVAINITLEFLELELIDRKRVYNKDRPVSSGY